MPVCLYASAAVGSSLILCLYQHSSLYEYLRHLVFILYPQSLPDALTTLCEILSPDKEGGPAHIPLEQFQQLYGFLASVDGGISKEQVASVISFLKTEA